jgi:3-hydroxyacyl-[acyl-carrier-protein] dehydratase
MNLAAGARPADLDVLQIKELIPHRYPFLMIERLTEIVPFESAVGIKNVWN